MNRTKPCHCLNSPTVSRLLRFGEISLAIVLQVLLTLLIFFLGFGIVATDIELATLRLVLSQGVSWKASIPKLKVTVDMIAVITPQFM